jgi:hypothetical protein
LKYTIAQPLGTTLLEIGLTFLSYVAVPLGKAKVLELNFTGVSLLSF